jgi:hypothetical protein
MWSGGESIPTLGGLSTFVLVCGMFIRHFSDETSAQGVISRYGIGAMARSEEIKEALMVPELISERLRWDAALLGEDESSDRSAPSDPE